MGILAKDFPTAKTIEGKTETCHCNKKWTVEHKKNRNREDQINTNEEEFNEEYGENKMTEEELQKEFIKHKTEERLQELYNMSYEQEKEMIDYGWRPCRREEIEKHTRYGIGGSKGRDRRYREIRIPKSRAESQYNKEEQPKETRIIINNIIIPFRTVVEATEEIINKEKKSRKRKHDETNKDESTKTKKIKIQKKRLYQSRTKG